jgi:hypothetical protein
LYSHDEFFNLDINWFGVDYNGRVGNFTTGGLGVAPPMPARGDRESNELLLEQVRALPCTSQVIHLEKSRLSSPHILHVDEYLRSFDGMAVGGLFAFDIWKRLDDGSVEYICAAAPASVASSLQNLPTASLTNCAGNFALGVRVRVSVDGLKAYVVN